MDKAGRLGCKPNKTQGQRKCRVQTQTTIRMSKRVRAKACTLYLFCGEGQKYPPLSAIRSGINARPIFQAA